MRFQSLTGQGAEYKIIAYNAVSYTEFELTEFVPCLAKIKIEVFYRGCAVIPYGVELVLITVV